eukprot:CAMPEP_0174372304 /NCGR_PEP_ID=MMETSP0811_2-20130205/103128_1 /TAXON_ID=73025 ORGANISM="Eutreptiella gymnastica-like, Strain CCMP1594" /NCGR_SAMPLE_ID=MMETSP0811_2 /ASSEMBLY_ACC=CAM_ASM_000667 /LENGTH=48 /DNA_ID= /DNA_START= /DNA_END= /DNA_ORIENTATION=
MSTAISSTTCTPMQTTWHDQGWVVKGFQILGKRYTHPKPDFAQGSAAQ